MKPQLTLLSIILALVAGPVFAQQPDKINFSEEVSIVGMAQDALYEKAKVVFIDKYNNSPFPLRMNKNTGDITSGAKEEIDVSSKLKTTPIVLNYKIKMTLRENGYSLNVTDFYYSQTVKKSKGNIKHFLCNSHEGEISKKNKVLQSKLKQQAITIAQQILDDVKKDMYKKLSDLEIVNNTTSENTHW